MARYFLTLGILAVIQTTIINSAKALMNTDQLRLICEAGLENPVRDDPKFAFCTGAALGTLMTDSIERHLICIPSEIDTKTALRIFIQRAIREPYKDIEGFVTMHRAFLEAYPCKLP